MLFKILVFSFFTFVFSFLVTPSTFAQTTESIKNFDTSITAHKDGTMTIEEKINYNFGDNDHHGIFREIPLVSKVGDLYRITEVDFEEIKRDGQEEEYEVDNNTDLAKVKIGDPEKEISGQHSYLIVYTVTNGIGSNYEDHDEIYWNTTGNHWQIPIEKASATIKTDFGVNTDRVACFTRSANFNAQFCTFDSQTFNPVTTTNVMAPGEGLTVVASFPVGTFPKSTLQKSKPQFDPDFLNLLKLYVPIVLGLNFLLAPYLLFWYFAKKSKTRFGKPSVNFDIPENKGQRISPSEAGIIDNTKFEKNDVVATIFDLAIRKYLTVKEIKQVRTLMPDYVDYRLTMEKGNEGLNEFEKTLFNKLFEKGDNILLKDLGTDFYLTFQRLEKEAFNSLVERKLYSKNPKNQMGTLLTFGILALVTGNIILGPVLIFLSRKLNGRTELGDEIDFKVDGLKIFLKSVNRYHKFQSKNLITVEKYIPYAIALGLQDEFMEQLKVINSEYKPSWYLGSGNFYLNYASFGSVVNSNITTSAPSSSSGFSGGGFSGGGGGGGGGGSW